MNPTDLICARFGFSYPKLLAYINTCPYRYKTYPINKRNSDEKRYISQPSRDLKVIQRFIINEFLENKLAVHDFARAYKKGASIVENARLHIDNRYLLKMDFKDFFPSILSRDFENYLIDQEIVSAIEAKLVARIFFKVDNLGNLRLSIGSPGSPLISNALMFKFDDIVSRLCTKHSVTYTRYSDDLSFSTNIQNLLFEWPDRIKEIVAKLEYPSLIINDEKTVFSSMKFNRHVTGITITNDGTMSIGHNRKRVIRSKVFKVGGLNKAEVAVLRGHIAFANQVEKDFIQKLLVKYPEQMSLILKPS